MDNKPGLWIFAAIVALVVWIVLPYALACFTNPSDSYSEYILSERSNIGQLISALAVVTGLWIAAEKIKVALEGQLNKRLDRAIENLASENIIVRLDALQSIEVILDDSPKSQPRGIAALSAFVRQNSDLVKEEGGWIPPTLRVEQDPSGKNHVRHDVWKASQIIVGRKLTKKTNHNRIDLSGANLRYVNFAGGSLEKATLDFADLTGALVEGTIKPHIDPPVLDNRFLASGVSLLHAEVVDAVLSGVDLSGARVNGCNFEGTKFHNVDFSGAIGRPKSFHDVEFVNCDLNNTPEFKYGDLAKAKSIDDETYAKLPQERADRIKKEARIHRKIS